MFRTQYSGANTPFVSLYEEHQHFHQNPEKNHHLFCFPPTRSSVDIQFFCMSDSDYPRAFVSFPRMAGCVSEIGSSPGILAIMNQGDRLTIHGSEAPGPNTYSQINFQKGVSCIHEIY